MVSLDRRALISGALAATALPAVAAAAAAAGAGPLPATNLRFNILRNGKPFGQYSVVFAANDEILKVTTDVAMYMHIGKLNVFDYRHHCEEIWRGGKFLQMNSRTVRDRQAGTADEVSAVRGNIDVRITTKGGTLSAPLEANPLTHWNQAVLSGPLFNPQTGSPVIVKAQSLGHDNVALANGALIRARHWALRGDASIDDWYDEAGVWAGLRGPLPDKSLLEYRRV